MRKTKAYIKMMFILLVFFTSVRVNAAVRNTDVTEAREGAEMVAVKGTFIKADKDQVLQRLNEIRKEACEEGIINENTGNPLTLDDYVPLQWANRLQQLAETRSAEAAVVFSHSRLNGWLCPHSYIDEDGWIITTHSGKICQTNNYVSATLECLAGKCNGAMQYDNYMDEVKLRFLDAIDMWYGEKDYLGGHYMEMINMDMDYVGMAVFQSNEISTTFLESGYYTIASTSALELTNKSWADYYEDDYLERLSDDSETGTSGEYLQLLELDNKRIIGFYLNYVDDQVLQTGDSDQLYTVYHVNDNSNGYTRVRYLGDIEWESTDPNVLSVDENGNIHALASGKASIIAVNSEGKRAQCNFVIEESSEYDDEIWEDDDILISKITLQGLSNKVAEGKKIQLSAKISPWYADYQQLKWSSSDTKIATVNQNGLVTIKSKTGGKSVTIKAKALDGSGKSAYFKIKVMKGAVKSVKIKGTKKTLKIGKKMKLKAVVKMTKGKPVNKKVIWTSSNTKYATVSAKGVVKALKAGKGKKVKITAMATDGTGKKKTITISIK